MRWPRLNRPCRRFKLNTPAGFAAAHQDQCSSRELDRGNNMADETARLAAYVADLRFEDIPEEVRARAKALTLDFLGSAIRARRDAESTPSLFGTLEALALENKG